MNICIQTKKNTEPTSKTQKGDEEPQSSHYCTSACTSQNTATETYKWANETKTFIYVIYSS